MYEMSVSFFFHYLIIYNSYERASEYAFMKVYS